uniref:Uncharacterized protein n=1 Tax=Sheathia arcuata TaxID=340433 RepID=A0A343UY22_9FLOR|nr:hypothetical protein [Sheathia arcuata]
MIYNYPRLQLNFKYLQKYDIIDKKLIFHKVNFACTYRTRIESMNIEKLNFLSTSVTQEWLCGQKSAIQNCFLYYKHNTKSIYFETILRKLSFWNFLDLYINSIFIHNYRNSLKMIFYFEKMSYFNTFSFNLWQNNFLFTKLKENSSEVYHLKQQSSVKSTHFYFS